MELHCAHECEHMEHQLGQSRIPLLVSLKFWCVKRRPPGPCHCPCQQCRTPPPLEPLQLVLNVVQLVVTDPFTSSELFYSCSFGFCFVLDNGSTGPLGYSPLGSLL